MNSGLKSQQVYDDTSNIVAMPMDYQVRKVHMTSSATIRRLKLTANIGSKAGEVSDKANQVNRPDGHPTEARQHPLSAPDLTNAGLVTVATLSPTTIRKTDWARKPLKAFRVDKSQTWQQTSHHKYRQAPERYARMSSP